MKCKNCGKLIYMDMEQYWAHKRPIYEDPRVCKILIITAECSPGKRRER